MEEQRPAGGAEWQIPKLIEDDEVGMGEPACELSGLSLQLLLFKGVEEFDGREEPDTLAMTFDSLDADGRGEMLLISTSDWPVFPFRTVPSP